MQLSTPGRRRSLIAASTLAAILCALPGTAQEPPEAVEVEVAVVVHPDVQVDDLSFVELRKLLLGDRQFWSPGLRVTLLVQPPRSPEREIILKKVYKMKDAQFRQYWIAKVFRAEASSGPKIVVSNAMALSLVANIPGAVAMVNVAEVPKGVKILAVDGHRPGDAGYALR